MRITGNTKENDQTTSAIRRDHPRKPNRTIDQLNNMLVTKNPNFTGSLLPGKSK